VPRLLDTRRRKDARYFIIPIKGAILKKKKLTHSLSLSLSLSPRSEGHVQGCGQRYKRGKITGTVSPAERRLKVIDSDVTGSRISGVRPTRLLKAPLSPLPHSPLPPYWSAPLHFVAPPTASRPTLQPLPRRCRVFFHDNSSASWRTETLTNQMTRNKMEQRCGWLMLVCGVDKLS
jgi:hypothetical protein